MSRTAITVRISAARDILNAYREHLYKLKSMKAGLMQDLLTGDRRVTALLEQSEDITSMSQLHQERRPCRCGFVNYRFATSGRSTHSQ